MHLQLAVLARGDFEHLKGPKDARVHRELIHIDLGEHGVQMHERAAVGDVEGQNGLDGGLFAGEDVAGNHVDGVRLGALGNANGQHLVVQVQNVAALNVEGVVTVEELRHMALEIGVVVEDVFRIDGLAVAGDGIHAVQADAVADGGERVAREVEVGHRVDDQLAGLADKVYQRVLGIHVELIQVHAFHRLQHKFLVVFDFVQMIVHNFLPVFGADAGLADELLQEFLAHGGVCVQHFRHQVFQVHHFHAVLTQNLGKAVMLGLGHFQEGDIVEQKTPQRIGREVQQLFARPVKKYFFERLNLARYMDTNHCLVLLSKCFLRTSSAEKVCGGGPAPCSPTACSPCQKPQAERLAMWPGERATRALMAPRPSTISEFLVSL